MNQPGYMQVTPSYGGAPHLEYGVYFATTVTGSSAVGSAHFILPAPSATTFSLTYSGSVPAQNGEVKPHLPAPAPPCLKAVRPTRWARAASFCGRTGRKAHILTCAFVEKQCIVKLNHPRGFSRGRERGMPVEVIDFVWLGIAILAAVVEAVVPSLVSVWFVARQPGRPGCQPVRRSLSGCKSLCSWRFPWPAWPLPGPWRRSCWSTTRSAPTPNRVVGATGIVIQDIDNVVSTGRVTVMGNSWSAPLHPEGRENRGGQPGAHRKDRGGQAAGHPGGAPRSRKQTRLLWKEER